MSSIIASIGFVLAIISFIAGFRMIKKTGHVAEHRMHKINGYLTLICYVLVALLSIISGTKFLYIMAWILGLGVHLLKLFFVKKGLAVRYGGYLGAMLLITWIIVIFTHLPK